MSRLLSGWRLLARQSLIRGGLGHKHDPCGNPAGLDVSDRLVYPDQRSRLTYDARLASAVQLEDLA